MKIKTPDYINISSSSFFTVTQDNSYSVLSVNPESDLTVNSITSQNICVSNTEVGSLTIKRAGSGVTLDNFGTSLISSGTIAPTSTGASDLGGSSFQWGTVYTQNIKVSEKITPSDTTVDLGKQTTPFGNAYSLKVNTYELTLWESVNNYSVKLTSDSNSIQLNVSGNLKVDQDLYSNSLYVTGVVQAGKVALQGDTSNFKVMYKPSSTVYEIITANASSFTCNTSTSITLTTTKGAIKVNQDSLGGVGQITFSIKGLSDTEIKDYYLMNNSSFYPKERDGASLGTSYNRFKDIFCKNLHGVLPNYSEVSGMWDLGAIIFVSVRIAGQASSQVALSAGTTFECGATRARILYSVTITYTNNSTAIFAEGSRISPDPSGSDVHTYRLLTNLPALSSSSDRALALVMRIE